MSGKRRGRRGPGGIYAFGLCWVALSILLPLYEFWGLLLNVALCGAAGWAVGRFLEKKRRAKEDEESAQAAQKAEEAKREEKAPASANPPEVEAILKEGNLALSEMGRLYMSIRDPEVKAKINELMRITDKIAQDAVADPSDIPQIRKFFSYYMPTTIKLLNTYDRMSAQGIEGENLNKSMKSINEMLDEIIAAFKKRLDSLFENQALDIETDIEVMNKLLAREGLTGGKDFDVKQEQQP